MKPKYPKPDIPSGCSPKRRPVVVDRQEVVDQLAKRIRLIYIAQFREWDERVSGKPSRYLPGVFWDGGLTRTGIRRRNIWKKLAEFFLEHSLDPGDYLRTQFFFTGFARPRLPNQLLSAGALADYRCTLRQEEEGVLISRALQAQRGHLLEAARDWQWDNREGFTPKQIQLAILLDEDLSLSALFRFCIAIEEKLDAVAERYLFAAALQYLSHSDGYDKVWGSWLPEWFCSAARKCREKRNREV